MKIKIITLTLMALVAHQAIAENVIKKDKDELLEKLKTDSRFEDQRRIGNEVLKRSQAEKEEYTKYKELENIGEDARSDNEKLADKIFKKVKREKGFYESIAKDSERIIKKSESEMKLLAKDIEKKIYAYSQNHLENKETSEEITEENVVAKSLEGYSRILKANKEGEAGFENGLYIAVSLSMPESTIINLSKWVQMWGGKLVMRGLKNNSFKETIAAIEGLKEHGVAVEINPKLFRSYDIKLVPTYVFIHEDKSDILTGNVSLRYVLDQFSRKGDTKEEAARWLKRFK